MKNPPECMAQAGSLASGKVVTHPSTFIASVPRPQGHYVLADGDVFVGRVSTKRLWRLAELIGNTYRRASQMGLTPRST